MSFCPGNPQDKFSAGLLNCNLWLVGWLAGWPRSWIPNIRACQTQGTSDVCSPSDHFNRILMEKELENSAQIWSDIPVEILCRCNSELKVIFSMRSPISDQFKQKIEQKKCCLRFPQLIRLFEGQGRSKRVLKKHTSGRWKRPRLSLFSLA